MQLINAGDKLRRCSSGNCTFVSLAGVVTTCDQDHPGGYEWCVNAAAIDSQGLVYVTSEDGNIYSLPQGNHGVFTTPRQKIFLKEALGAAYTPLAIGSDGKIYRQNDGDLFVVGQVAPGRTASGAARGNTGKR